MKKKIFTGVVTAMMLVFTMGTTVFADPSPTSDTAQPLKAAVIMQTMSLSRFLPRVWTKMFTARETVRQMLWQVHRTEVQPSWPCLISVFRLQRIHPKESK